MLQCHGNKINSVWFLFSSVGWLKGLRLWDLAAGHPFWGPWPAPCSKRRGEGTWEVQSAEHSCSVRSCPGGKPCKSCSLQSQGSSSRRGSCLPLSHGHSCAGGSAGARGILHTQGCSLSSLQLVPLTAIWKYLSSCFGAKEQLAYTLLLLHYPP